MGGTEIAVREPRLLSPGEIVEKAAEQARFLMDIVEKTKCYQDISGKKYLQVEAWETIGAFNRVYAQTSDITPILQQQETVGYEAEVELCRDGVVIGRAIMPCYFSEPACRGKEGDSKHKAAMSAAQTFATSKAYRMNFSYVAILAGFQPLPAEELPDDIRRQGTEPKGHWCSEHQMPFFKKGKMKSYAHPIKGSDPVQWCHEHKEPQEAPQPAPQPQESKPSVVGKESSGPTPTKELDFDPVVLKEQIAEVKWKDATVRSFCKNAYKVGAGGQLLNMEQEVVDLIASLKKQDREAFFKELSNRKSML